MRLGALVAGLVWATTLSAQGAPPPTTPPTTPPRDTTARGDSAAVPAVVRDTLKAPFTAAPTPTVGTRRWGREEIFQSGATSLAELLQLIPGTGMLRSGMLLAPQLVTYWGEVGRVRVFLDGVELDPLDARGGGVADLARISVWQLDDLMVEATPSELRVHLRSWRVNATVPESRVDVLSGDLESNLYRGFFGRRFASGLGVQFAFQQFSTESRSIGGDGNALALFGRLGWARGKVSIDGTVDRASVARAQTLRANGSNGFPSLRETQTNVYGRVGVGNAALSRYWAQLTVASASHDERSTFRPAQGPFAADSADTTRTRMQHVLQLGTNIGAASATGGLRHRRYGGESYLTPSVRGSWTWDRSGLSAFVERSADDSLLRADLLVRAGLLERLVISGGYSRRSSFRDSVDAAWTFLHAEAALRLGRWWLRAGFVQRDSTDVLAPAIFGAGVAATAIPRGSAITYGLAGPIYRAVRVEVAGVRRPEGGIYQPQSQIRARIGLETDWREKFPRGDFTIRAWIGLERHGASLFPSDTGAFLLPGEQPLTSLLEIRIRSATIIWQFRNFLGAPYQTVPGYDMPRRVNLYGVRWNFRN
jgi:hypothetical protein